MLKKIAVELGLIDGRKSTHKEGGLPVENNLVLEGLQQIRLQKKLQAMLRRSLETRWGT